MATPPPRVKTSQFKPANGPRVVMVKFSLPEVHHLAPLFDSTEEYYVDDAIRALLMAMVQQPPSEFLFHRTALLNLKAEYAKHCEAVIKEKLREAVEKMDDGATHLLMERGITE